MFIVPRICRVRRLVFPFSIPGNCALVYHWEDHMGDRRQATATKPTLAALAMP